MPNETPFPELERWMIRNPDAARELSTSTRDRYLKGGIPAPLLWFLRHPGALKALGKDADDLTPETLEEIQTQVETRSSRQRQYRNKDAGEEPAAETKPARRGRKSAA